MCILKSLNDLFTFYMYILHSQGKSSSGPGKSTQRIRPELLLSILTVTDSTIESVVTKFNAAMPQSISNCTVIVNALGSCMGMGPKQFHCIGLSDAPMSV